MIRGRLIERAATDAEDADVIVGSDGFRWRGRDVSRIEGFSDAVFGFALTLLVVSLEVPKTFDQLNETMRGFLSFAICFALLALVWHGHYKYFRRYGLSDPATMILNLVLLFLVVFYVYPLKFMWTITIDLFVFHREPVVFDATGAAHAAINPSQWPIVMAYFGIGYAA